MVGDAWNPMETLIIAVPHGEIVVVLSEVPGSWVEGIHSGWWYEVEYTDVQGVYRGYMIKEGIELVGPAEPG